MREELLDWVPEERARYTRLGIIVLNTGLMAALSLFVALTRLVDVPSVVIVPVALFWGFLVATIDSWMIASTHGVLGSRKLWVLVPRLLIAILLGTVIAEPLLLWVFQPAINTEVQQERQRILDGYESRLTACNPTVGTNDDPDCRRNFSLNVASPTGIQQKLDSTKAQRDALEPVVTDLTGQLAAKQQLAINECAGTSGPGTTGVPGFGQACKADWQAANDFKALSGIDGKQKQLDQLNDQLAATTTQLAAASSTYADQVKHAIDGKVADRRNSFAPPSLLDEDEALGELSATSAMVAGAEVLVRLLLIVVDCLPVLTKMIGGNTTYDYLVAEQRGTESRLRRKWLDVHEAADSASADKQLAVINSDRDVVIHRRDSDRDIAMQAIDATVQSARLQHDAGLDADIDRLAARYAERDPDGPTRFAAPTPRPPSEDGEAADRAREVASSVSGGGSIDSARLGDSLPMTGWSHSAATAEPMSDWSTAEQPNIAAGWDRVPPSAPTTDVRT